MTSTHSLPSARAQGTAWEVFKVFLKLGFTSFGGPIAHLSYFRSEFVEGRQWLEEQEYADLVTLCQFLPGPASSQVSFALGMHRAGILGALAAFLAFTLPSALLLVLFAAGASLFFGPTGEGLLAGLKLVAVAIVAQAVLGMAKSLAPDRQRASIAVLAAGSSLLLAGSAGQVIAILLGALAGYLFCRSSSELSSRALYVPVGRGLSIASAVTFMVLLLGLPLIVAVSDSGSLELFAAFYQAGSLVFGGGHVVLALLQSSVLDTGWVSSQEFLAGYGAAQAVPGPLFTFAAYLGAVSSLGPGGLLGAGIALLAIFLPGFLLLLGVLPVWNFLRQRLWLQALMRGANAAVVGLLAAALYTPVFSTAVNGAFSFILAMACFVLLTVWKLPPWVVVLVGAAAGAVFVPCL